MNTSFAVPDSALFADRRSTLVRRAQRLVGSANAEDVVHDAFERALRARTFRSGYDARPWLDRIARNVAVDRLRAHHRQLPAPPSPSGGESPEGAVLRDETAREVRAALRSLPPAQRRAVVLHDLHGYSNHEIASLDGVPYHTVRTRLFRARRALRAALHREIA